MGRNKELWGRGGLNVVVHGGGLETGTEGGFVTQIKRGGTRARKYSCGRDIVVVNWAVGNGLTREECDVIRILRE